MRKAEYRRLSFPRVGFRRGRRRLFFGTVSPIAMVDRNATVLADQLLALPVPDRARLASLLLASLETADANAAEAWDAEIARRTGRIRCNGRLL
jgi:hypothetical protein